MQKEAARQIAGVRSEFVAALRDVLSEEGGRSANETRRLIHEHPDHEVEVPMKYLHSWLYFVTDEAGLSYDSTGVKTAYSLRDDNPDDAQNGALDRPDAEGDVTNPKRE